MPRALVAAGSGRYADPWHPYRDTAGLIAEVLTGDGWQVEVDDDLDRALTRLDGVDLLVVAAGDPWRNGETGFGAPSEGALRESLARGIGILALHTALATLRDYPDWRRAIGGEWTEGRSWHPEISDAAVHVIDGTHPVTAGLRDFTLYDERYTDLEVDPDVGVLAVHEWEGLAHPLVWVREPGSARVVVSALGHEERAFRSPEHRRLLRQAARWAGRVGDAAAEHAR